jgi:hypothetical protein
LSNNAGSHSRTDSSFLSPSFYVLIALLRTDKVHVHHRPLAAYLFTESVNAICELDYKRRGMERLRFGAVECAATASLPFCFTNLTLSSPFPPLRLGRYLVRTPASWSSAAKGLDPLIYIHGLGFGHLQNHKLLVRLLDEFPDRPVIVPQQENISMTVVRPPFEPLASRRLESHGRDRC